MLLRLLLGDQLHIHHSWFRERRPDVVYVLMEVRSETDYVRHHIQKVIGFFLAMRHFAVELEAEGHRVHYIRLDDPANRQGIEANLEWLLHEYGATHFEYLLPDEWRLDEALRAFCAGLKGVTSAVLDTEHFLSDRAAVHRQFADKKTYLMEAFYRKMREKHQILMEPDGKTPLFGRWNFDAENRKKLPKQVSIPPATPFYRDVSELADMIQKAGVQTIGRLDVRRFDWPVTRAENLQLLHDFLRFRLRFFGDYQDAMTGRDWLLFHSRLSFALNLKLLHPMEVIQAAVDYWQSHQDLVPYAALEGFVRQIIGWREYMRGIYWAEMPGYRSLNYFGHQAPLPEWYWTGETDMACLHQAITQSLDRAYAHHIQRLMLTGNFALLLGVHPDEVDAWYLGIYMDAVEWVEITNTRGMSQFADGGIVGTKPYVSSANYIHKMSDHCAGCRYDRSLRHGPNACPFNSLYWDFHHRHRALLERNPRIGMVYKVWDGMAEEERRRILEAAGEVRRRDEEEIRGD
jgi:deoxyribodipyrimidine photolyase-related protein